MNVWSDKSFNYMHHKTNLPRLALQFASHSDVIFLCILSFCCCHCCVVWFYWMAQGSKSFLSLKRLGVILLPPGWDASPSQGYPQHLICQYLFIHLSGYWGTVRVQCFAQEQNTMFPARAGNQTAQNRKEIQKSNKQVIYTGCL